MWEHSQIIIDSINNLFKNVQPTTKLSTIASEREHDPEQFIKRITPQIIKSYQNGWLLGTPDEWDDLFDLFGGGQKYRRSSAILKRMTWEQFLYNAELVIKEYLSD